MSKKKKKKDEPLVDENLGCGEDVGNYGDVIVHKDGSTTLKYDHGGIPWYLAILYTLYLLFAVGYSGTFLVDLF